MSAQWTRLFAVVCLIGALPDSQPVYAQAACLGASHSCPVNAAAGGRVCRGSIELRYQEPAVVNTVVRDCLGLVDDLPDGIVRIEGSLRLGRAVQNTNDPETGLTDLSKLSGLTEITGDLIVERQNQGISNLNALRSLRTIGGTFRVGAEARTAGGGNGGLSSVGDLPALTTIRGSFLVFFNVRMRTLGNFPALQSIGGFFRLVGNSPSGEFTSLGNFPALRRVRDFVIEEQLHLPNAGRFASLIEIERDFQLFSNNRLRTLGDFPVLRTIGRDLQVGTFTTGTRNPSLTNLNGFSALESIGRNVSIRGNQRLTECCAVAIAVRAGSGDVDIRENGFGVGTCSEAAIRDTRQCPGPPPTVPTATISAPTTAIAETDLNGTELEVTLFNVEYVAAGSLVPAQFTITRGGASLVTVSGVVRTSSTVATLTLAYTSGIFTNTGLGVTVGAAAHTGDDALPTVDVASVSGSGSRAVRVTARPMWIPEDEAAFDTQTFTFTAGVDVVNLTLPQATGGNGQLRYRPDSSLNRADRLPAIGLRLFDSEGLLFPVPDLREGEGRTCPCVISGSASSSSVRDVEQRVLWIVIDSDGVEADDSDRLLFRLIIRPRPSDIRPTFGSGLSRAGIDDQVFTINQPLTPLTLPAATGGDGTLSYTFADGRGGLPTGLSFDAATRVLSGTPTATQAETDYTYTVRDDDANTNTSDTDTLSFAITVNVPPALSFGGSISAQTYAMGTPRTVTLPAAIGGTGPYTYALSGMPSGLSFAVGTRVLSGTPDAMQVATTYTYTATDSATPSAAMVTLDVTIEVVAPATANIDGNTEVNHLDGLVMYLSLNPVFRSLRSTERFRNELMGHLRTSAVGTTRELVANAEAWRNAAITNSDVDGVGGVTHLDGLVIYLSLNPVFRSLRGTERFRNELMGHLRTPMVDTTQGLVDNANALVP